MIGIGLNLWPGRAGTPPEPVPAVAQPSITSPVDDAVDVSLTPTLTSSAFAVTNGGSDTHASSDWQVAEDAGFSTIAAESLDDATNKVSWTVPGAALDNEVEYFARVRHTGATLGDSPWSGAVSFRTLIAGAGYTFTNAEAEAFIAAFAADPENWYKERIDTAVSDLKTAGLWSTRDVIYPMWAPPGEGSDGFLLNLKNPAAFKLIPVNSPTFTPYAGGAGNGTSSYYNTGWVPNTHAVSFSQNNCSAGFFIDAGDDTSNANASPFGSQDGSARGIRVYPRSTSDRLNANINSSSLSQLGFPIPATRQGLTVVERSTSSLVTGYRDGASTGTDNETSGSITSMPAFFIGCTNFNGSPLAGSYTNNRMSCVQIGAAMGSTGNADWYDIMAALRAPPP